MTSYRALGYRFRSLSRDQERAVRQAFRDGANTRALADAYGVSRRTIYRAIHRASHAVHRIVVGPYVATFELEDGAPVQTSPWLPT